MKSILVTGATGFLGKHLVEKLKASEREARIRVLCRGASPWEEDAQVEAVRGDITSSADVDRAAAGMTEIYHLAGVVSRDPRAASLLYQTHIEGTRQVCEAARRYGVRRIVLVSSSGTIAVGHESVAHGENSGYKHEVVGEWPYYLSKIFAEKLAFSYFAQYQLPVVIVNPSLLLGPGDDRSSSTHDVALFLESQIRAIPLGGLNFVDARDAARGLIAAMRSGSPGERYLLGGPNWTFREFIQHLAEVSGVRAPKMQPSLRMQLASARLLRRLMPLVGKSFPLDDVSIKMSALFWYCDTRKARAELGFTTRDPIETLKDTVEDLRRQGSV
ncbi:MAG TPA: NAD-dependent epimerase/dehydratase family protein [Terriglobia bacterium]|nr:NAD-dependent epimerase/dehydratase family protein [Terriglobia bacterium]